MLFMGHQQEGVQEYPRSVPDRSRHFLQCQEKHTHRTVISHRQASPTLLLLDRTAPTPEHMIRKVVLAPGELWACA